jgi:ERCC4-type nuclease
MTTNQLLSVIIDSREPPWVQGLTFGNAPTAVAPLEAGDFLLATSDNCLLNIERKTSDDLLNTLAHDDRLFVQCSQLARPWAYLLITGPLYPDSAGHVVTARQTRWTWASLQGALLTVQELGVHVLHAPTDADLVPALVRLATRDRGTLALLPPRQPNILGPGEAALAALPGIGLERLNAVLAHTGTPAWGLMALTQPDGEHIPGIGPATKARIRRALGLDDDLQIVVTPLGAVIDIPTGPLPDIDLLHTEAADGYRP